jgi:hypothetical protein
MSQQTYEHKFKTSLLQFLDELIEQYPTYPSIVIVRIFIKDKISAKNSISTFVEKVLPYHTLVEKKNEILFTELDVIYKSCFGATTKRSVENLKTIWTKSDDDNKKAIWRWIDFFTMLSTKYHKKFMTHISLKSEQERIDKLYN